MSELDIVLALRIPGFVLPKLLDICSSPSESRFLPAQTDDLRQRSIMLLASMPKAATALTASILSTLVLDLPLDSAISYTRRWRL